MGRASPSTCRPNFQQRSRLGANYGELDARRDRSDAVCMSSLPISTLPADVWEAPHCFPDPCEHVCQRAERWTHANAGMSSACFHFPFYVLLL